MEALDLVAHCAVTGNCAQLQNLGSAVKSTVSSVPGFAPATHPPPSASWLGQWAITGADTSAAMSIIPITVIVSVLCCILGFVASRMLLLRYSSQESMPRLAPVRTSLRPASAYSLAAEQHRQSPLARPQLPAYSLAAAGEEVHARTSSGADAATSGLEAPRPAGLTVTQVLERLKAEDEARRQEGHQQEVYELLEPPSVPVTPSTPTAQTPSAPMHGVSVSEDGVSVASTASVVPAQEAARSEDGTSVASTATLAPLERRLTPLAPQHIHIPQVTSVSWFYSVRRSPDAMPSYIPCSRFSCISLAGPECGFCMASS